MKGLWAVSLPMTLRRTLCVFVHIWLCTPGPRLSRAASVPLEPVALCLTLSVFACWRHMSV